MRKERGLQIINYLLTGCRIPGVAAGSRLILHRSGSDRLYVELATYFKTGLLELYALASLLPWLSRHIIPKVRSTFESHNHGKLMWERWVW